MNNHAHARLMTVSAWSRYHPWPTAPAMRHYIRLARTNGLERAIHRVGRRVLIDEAEFLSWARARTNAGGQA